MPSNQAPIEHMARIVALLCVKPRSLPELRRLTELSPQSVRRHIDALESEGLVIVDQPIIPGKTGRSPMIVMWHSTKEKSC